jgi:hypothetical protein
MARHLTLTRIAVLAASLLAAPAWAQKQRACPHAESERDRIALTLQAAATCALAHDLMNACRSNTSGDVEFAEIVIGKCEPLFAAGLSAAARRAYEAERQACIKRYPRSGGTMNVSFAATCQAGVAARYAREAARRSRAK